MGIPIHMLFLTLSKLSYFAESQISLTKKIRNLPIKMLYIFSKPIALKMYKMTLTFCTHLTFIFLHNFLKKSNRFCIF